MQSIEPSLLPKLIRVKEYLATKVEQKAVYLDLITEIDALIDRLPHCKPKIKLVSCNTALSKQLKDISEQDVNLKQQYQLQIIPPDVKIQHIVHGCEFILLVCDRHEQISARKRLIQKSLAKNIGLAIVIIDDHQVDLSSWLKQQADTFPSEIVFLLDNFLVVTDPACVEQYQHNLRQLFTAALVKLETRLAQKLIITINSRIKVANQQKWQSIRASQELLYCQAEGVEFSRQQINQLIPKINKQQQHILQIIKQEINHKKAILINPFAKDNLIWSTQEIIHKSEIKIIKEEKNAYLLPIVKNNNIESQLCLYIADLYQCKFQNHLEQEWHSCNNTYANGGLKQLRSQITVELESIVHLADVTIKPKVVDAPKFQLANLAYLPILEAGSKLTFDYHFSQGKWFRFLMVASIVLMIYLVTKFLSGQGFILGFVIIIFQFINLFTGQDAKVNKLKQQSKELKRTLDNKYQILIRLSADKITRDLIAAVDEENRYYQQQIEEIAQIANQKLADVKKTIESDRQQINQLKQDREIISIITVGDGAYKGLMQVHASAPPFRESPLQ